jgi:hypothetical protein
MPSFTQEARLLGCPRHSETRLPMHWLVAIWQRPVALPRWGPDGNLRCAGNALGCDDGPRIGLRPQAHSSPPWMVPPAYHPARSESLQSPSNRCRTSGRTRDADSSRLPLARAREGADCCRKSRNRSLSVAYPILLAGPALGIYLAIGCKRTMHYGAVNLFRSHLSSSASSIKRSSASKSYPVLAFTRAAASSSSSSVQSRSWA